MKNVLTNTQTACSAPVVRRAAQLLEVYVRCPIKCWLRCAGENATGNAYAAWVQAKNEACWMEGIKRLIAEAPDGERVVASPTERQDKLLL